jgi:pyruvate kinase
MDLRHRRYTEKPLVKTKIIATVGPACWERERLKDLIIAGADLFRLNFAHGEYEVLERVLGDIRAVSKDLKRPIGVLGDLSGPKIRLGQLPEGGVYCEMGQQFHFVRGEESADPTQLTCTYNRLIDDLRNGDRILLADGTVAMRVIGKNDAEGRVVCSVEGPGLIRGRQGINLPGVTLSTPCLTEKDLADLDWAVKNDLDFIGLSFVRRADDVRQLRQEIKNRNPKHPPHIVAKIEKMEAVTELDEILDLTDAVMVARGDLGVEVDIERVPTLQKRIVKLCNMHRIPVITATQMLDSMQDNERPTREEASDVANAVLDGSDAVMLSGETAIGKYPVEAVAMMSRIALESERLVIPNRVNDTESQPSNRATLVTEAVTLGAGAAAERLEADLIVIATHSGKTAMALSKQRGQVPILALTDRPDAARRMCLYCGITPLETAAVQKLPHELLDYVVEWGQREKVIERGSRIVLVTATDWTLRGKNMMLVHALP